MKSQKNQTIFPIRSSSYATKPTSSSSISSSATLSSSSMLSSTCPMMVAGHHYVKNGTIVCENCFRPNSTPTTATKTVDNSDSVRSLRSSSTAFVRAAIKTDNRSRLSSPLSSQSKRKIKFSTTKTNDEKNQSSETKTNNLTRSKFSSSRIPVARTNPDPIQTPNIEKKVNADCKNLDETITKGKEISVANKCSKTTTNTDPNLICSDSPHNSKRKSFTQSRNDSNGKKPDGIDQPRKSIFGIKSNESHKKRTTRTTAFVFDAVDGGDHRHHRLESFMSDEKNFIQESSKNSNTESNVDDDEDDDIVLNAHENNDNQFKESKSSTSTMGNSLSLNDGEKHSPTIGLSSSSTSQSSSSSSFSPYPSSSFKPSDRLNCVESNKKSIESNDDKFNQNQSSNSIAIGTMQLVMNTNDQCDLDPNRIDQKSTIPKITSPSLLSIPINDNKKIYGSFNNINKLSHSNHTDIIDGNGPKRCSSEEPTPCYRRQIWNRFQQDSSSPSSSIYSSLDSFTDHHNQIVSAETLISDDDDDSECRSQFTIRLSSAQSIHTVISCDSFKDSSFYDAETDDVGVVLDDDGDSESRSKMFANLDDEFVDVEEQQRKESVIEDAITTIQNEVTSMKETSMASLKTRNDCRKRILSITDNNHCDSLPKTDNNSNEKTITNDKSYIFISECRDIDEMIGSIESKKAPDYFQALRKFKFEKIRDKFINKENENEEQKSMKKACGKFPLRNHSFKSRIDPIKEDEEIDSSSIRIRENRAMNGHLSAMKEIETNFLVLQSPNLDVNNLANAESSQIATEHSKLFAKKIFEGNQNQTRQNLPAKINHSIDVDDVVRDGDNQNFCFYDGDQSKKTAANNNEKMEHSQNITPVSTLPSLSSTTTTTTMAMMPTLTCKVQYLNDIDPFSACTKFPEPSRPPLFTFNVDQPLIKQISSVHHLLQAPHRLEDCALQLYRFDTITNEYEYGPYIDLEMSIDEQNEEFDGFTANRKNAVILRTQMSVRIHAIIEKLLDSSGRELRRALFSLKQIFQDDKDLVHEFVQNDGLACLIKVGSESDQNYQNYILRALGQVMLYVDGMNGVIEHPETIQWFYSLISSEHRLVVKTAFKLLLVFVEYADSNCLILITSIHQFDNERGLKPWHNIMNILQEKDSADTELLIFAITLINKTLQGVSDLDTFYDVCDPLEEQGIGLIIQHYMSKHGTDRNLLQQFHAYESELKLQDGEIDDDDDDGAGVVEGVDAHHLYHRNNRSNSNAIVNAEDQRRFIVDMRQIPRLRKSGNDESDRRKSKRHSMDSVRQSTSTSSILFNHKFGSNFSSTSSTSTISSLSSVISSASSESSSSSTTEAATTPSFRRLLNEKNMVNNLSSASSSPLTDSIITVINPSMVSNGFDPINHIEWKKTNERRKGCKHLVREKEIHNQRSSISSCSSADSFGSYASYGSYVSNDDPKSTTLIDSLKHFNPSSSVDSNEDDTDRSLDLNSRSSNHTESSDELLKPDNDFDHSQDCINNIWGGCRKASSMLNTGYHHHHGNNLARQPSLKDKNWVLTMMYGKNPDATEPKSPGFIKAAQHFSPGYWNDALNNENLSAPSATVINDLINLNNPSESVKCLKEKFKQQTNNQNQELNKNINQRVMYPKESISNDFSSNFEFFQWDQLTNQQFLRNLVIDNMDFTDLVDEDDVDICNPTQPLIQNGKNPTINSGKGVIGPPPPPPLMNGNSPTPPPPPLFSFNIGSSSNRQIKNEKILGSGNQSPSLNDSEHSALTKQKKTIKLFWKEVKEDKSLLSMIRKKKTIWDDIKPVPIDTKKLEHLFESRTKELMNKGIDRAQDANKKNEIHVLDTKRSNAINICLTKLPKLTAIEQAILKMDHTIMNREDIDKILTTMMPTDEERTKISEAKNQNPNLTLGQAETFLMILSSITALNERLKLWAFSLDYEQTEREIAEKLMDLKQAIYELEKSETFKIVLGTLRSIGNFLNGSEVKGFQIDYLAKVPEIKDTVHKHSLLYHLCQIVMEKNPNTSNLYCELGSVSRASKVDYEELGKSLKKIEQDCKQSCEYLKTISKHDGNNQQAMKMSKFLCESAKKIIVLQIIHRRLMNRLKKLLVFFGLPSSTIKDNKPNQLLKIISEFALEYRTTSERVREQLEKKANHRERNKTRGKLITEMDKFKTTKTKQDQTDLERMLTHSSTFSINSESNTKFDTPPGTKLRRPSTGSMHNLHHLLNNHLKAENDSSYDDNNCKRNGIAQPTRNLNAHRHSVHLQSLIGNEIDVNDEILEGLVRSTLQQPVCNNEKNRRKIRHSQRRSLRRTLKGNLDLTEEERMILGTIKT